MSSGQGQYRDTSEDPLSEKERKLVKRLLSDPLEYPQQLINWLDTKYSQQILTRIKRFYGHPLFGKGSEGEATLFAWSGGSTHTPVWTGRVSEGLSNTLTGFECLVFPICFNFNYTGTKYGAIGAGGGGPGESCIAGPYQFPSDGQWELIAWVGTKDYDGEFNLQKNGSDLLLTPVAVKAGESSYIGSGLGSTDGNDPTGYTWDLIFTSSNSGGGSPGDEVRVLLMLWPTWIYAQMPSGDCQTPTNTAAPELTPAATVAVDDPVSCSAGSWTTGSTFPTISYHWQKQGDTDDPFDDGAWGDWLTDPGDVGVAIPASPDFDGSERIRCVVTVANDCGSVSQASAYCDVTP